jgi:hypothetical protein
MGFPHIRLAPMSYLTMDDNDYVDGLIEIYALKNIVPLLREGNVIRYRLRPEDLAGIRRE